MQPQASRARLIIQIGEGGLALLLKSVQCLLQLLVDFLQQSSDSSSVGACSTHTC